MTLQASVGNRTTARLLQGAPVQMRSRGGSTPGAAALERAALGVHGTGRALPHLDRLQPLFGGHDLGAVRAFTGGASSRACEALGAEAYATGERVAFADSHPSVRTVAHEAAHVIQQRDGVHLAGGVGRVGDPYERQAERVADTVSAGGSAADLLPAASGPRRAAARGAPVQRLMSSAKLRDKAGDPTANTWGGYKQKSKRYRALLTALAAYETAIQGSIQPGPDDETYARVQAAIRAVESACDAFIERYDGLTGRAARSAATEVGRLAQVQALKQSAADEAAWIADIQDAPEYAGMRWAEALKQIERARTIERVRAMIESLADDDGASLESVRDTILELDDMEVKQALLADGGLRQFLRTQLDRTEAMIVASVLLDRSMQWYEGSGPDPKREFQIMAGGDFSLWILEGDENGEHKPSTRTGTMNCWEGVLFSMYVAGAVSYATLRDLHLAATRDAQEAFAQGGTQLDEDEALLKQKIMQRRFDFRITDTQEQVEAWYAKEIQDNPELKGRHKAYAQKTLGTDAYYQRLAANLGAHGAKEWRRGDPPPPAGDIVLFTGVGFGRQGAKYKIAHVCISLGRKSEHGTDIMNFGVPEGGHTIWGCSTIEEGLEHKYRTDYKVMYGPSALLRE